MPRSEQYTSTSKKGNYTDIYSVGGVFYYALTATKPMDATDRMLQEMPTPKSIVDTIPDIADKTIQKAMQMKPEDRYQSIAELMDDLVGKQVTADVESLRINKPLSIQKEYKSASAPSSTNVQIGTTNIKKLIFIISSAIVVICTVAVSVFIYVRKQDTVRYDEKVNKMLTEYHNECRKCNYKLQNANYYGQVDNFIEGIISLRKIEEYETDTEIQFPDTVRKGSDSLFVKLQDRLIVASCSLNERIESEPNKSEENIRWTTYQTNRTKLDWWLNQKVERASEYEMPARPQN